MPTLNQLIDAGTMTVSAIVSDYRQENYYVDESFQRRLVWTEKQKIRLIETILMGYPIPEIYLHQQAPDEDSDGFIRHSIVDGQQRIKCLSQFMANEFPLHSKHLDPDHVEEIYADKLWNELSPETKNLIRQYTFNAQTIPSEVTLEEIRKIFKRLNETDRSLNPQEIRHAEFDGEFIKVAEGLADIPFWRKYSIFNDGTIRRMGDVEFTTSLLSVLRNGITTDTTKSINDLYDLFNDSYDDAEQDRTRVLDRLNFIDKILSAEGLVREFFSKPVHLFTLFDLVPDLEGVIDAPQLVQKLNSFVVGYEGDEHNELFERYRSGSIQRTKSKLSRELRRDALREFVL